ncbi:hypothetical protein M2T28_14300 [Elizabethkingia miricola]|uniref:hypothetical protein n=1 Tax=Elizabethkingia miricola TaxID=172045 RepID=UPI00201927FA|nr:hypothetical protein [Elizabethkingia miricola]MCL1653792.1 hypothetical protein [Elizabethkingia miricola]
MPAAAAVVGGVVGIGSGLAQSIGAGRRAKRIQEQIDNYQRQTLQNPYNTLQVSTMGADLQREDLARSMATNANLLSMGGSRGLVGGLPNLMAQQVAAEQQIAANLDQQYIQNQNMKAQGNAMVQQMQEQRERDDLLGLGNELNNARQERTNGINTMVQSGLGLANAAASGVFSGDTGNNSNINSNNPLGLTTVLPGAEVQRINNIPNQMLPNYNVNQNTLFPNSPLFYYNPGIIDNASIFNQRRIG